MEGERAENKRPLAIDPPEVLRVKKTKPADEPPIRAAMGGGDELPDEKLERVSNKDLDDWIGRQREHVKLLADLAPLLPDKGEKLRVRLKKLEDEQRRRIEHPERITVDLSSLSPMAPGPPPASDSGIQPETDGSNPTIPELISLLRDSFHTADFDRAEQALILREANLKNQNRFLRETAELERLETLRLADELNALKKRKKHKFEMQKMQKVENDYAALQIKHQLQLEEKVKVENELKDCRVEMEKLKEELIVMEKKHRNEYEDIEQKHQSNSVEMLKFQNEVKLLKESSDHVIDLEDIPNSLPASEVSPRNGGLQTTDALKFSSGCSIIISDSDDDCAPGGKKQMGHKRKQDSSPNDNLEKDASSIKTAEMKQRKLGRCDSLVNYFSETVAPSAASHYGKQNKSASHTHIISGAIQKVRGTQKSCVESPAMSSKTPFDCESDDDSTSISSSDDSVDVDELQSMLSAAVEKAKA